VWAEYDARLKAAARKAGNEKFYLMGKGATSWRQRDDKYLLDNNRNGWTEEEDYKIRFAVTVIESARAEGQQFCDEKYGGLVPNIGNAALELSFS
jgi:hypothetical protein